ncbi:3-hydroxyacyl-CoA dehydrogenase [Roseiarcus fermentans]|uniref:3-hydroxyacyl-CoA dehydrogenase n=1 Tax=Roseiarcus fermentans TaxID=1473586 RepID=A0A366FCD4_9HYPH|nr:3-hydroxyacyl-CoA dehydrogenase NAD-binding domain-containing protein [Roseiarcus fermentans]RBP11365.1 3-hydroxyacyl-CoA dehydrogenase [Roseiarcus fermentans]
MNSRRGLVAVIGCGLIGESWAGLMTAYGHDVLAWDPSHKALDGFVKRVGAARAQAREAQPGLEAGEGAVEVVADVADAVRHADWVQENAPESAPLKMELYDRIEAATAATTVIASSTSSLTWSELSPNLRHKNRFITAHPFNPPHLMPLVEIYAHTPEMGAEAARFYQALGRETVLLTRDAAGHIANRLASALWREAVNIVAEGIADVASVDAALVHGPGLRWSVLGAHMAYHLGGGAGGIEHYLRHLGPSQERRWATLGNPRLTPEVCARLVEGVRAEAKGRSIRELEAQRDAALIRVLAARRGGEDAAG